MNKKDVKEDAKLQFRLNKELKQQFLQTCTSNEHKAADILREAIMTYLKHNNKGDK